MAPLRAACSSRSSRRLRSALPVPTAARRSPSTRRDAVTEQPPRGREAQDSSDLSGHSWFPTPRTASTPQPSVNPSVHPTSMAHEHDVSARPRVRLIRVRQRVLAQPEGGFGIEHGKPPAPVDRDACPACRRGPKGRARRPSGFGQNCATGRHRWPRRVWLAPSLHRCVGRPRRW
jgi:hypothetical protein